MIKFLDLKQINFQYQNELKKYYYLCSEIFKVLKGSDTFLISKF